MKSTLKTLLVVGAAVTALGIGVAIAGPGQGYGSGFGHHGGGHHGMMFVQGQPGQGMMGGGPGMMGGNHPRMQQRLMQLDTDGDGAVSKAEFEARFDQRFTALDTDKDGSVSKDEFMTADTAAVMGGMGGPGGGWDPATMPEDMQEMMEQRRAFMFRGLDADDSDSLSKDEMVAHMAPRFELMDADNDGKVTPDEMGRRGMWGGRTGPAPQQGQPAQ